MSHKVFGFHPEVSGEHSQVLSKTVTKSGSHFRKTVLTAEERSKTMQKDLSGSCCSNPSKRWWWTKSDFTIIIKDYFFNGLKRLLWAKKPTWLSQFSWESMFQRTNDMPISIQPTHELGTVYNLVAIKNGNIYKDVSLICFPKVQSESGPFPLQTWNLLTWRTS